ncbi:MAG: hypothetical protein IJQ71_12190 [Clostridia bacterium]|nr:hypothetical protein [Clostridia bacterium]
MSRKSRKAAPEEQRSAAEYYQLNTRAIEDLVTADESNSPKVSEEELRKYRSGPKIRLRDGVKAALIKWWFAGAVCFFFFWGLGIMIPSLENQMIVLGIGLGLVTDLLVNNIFRYYAKTPGANDRWIMVRHKGVAGMAMNLLYAFILLGLVVITYDIINRIAVGITGTSDTVPVGVEPILFGFLTMGWDLLLLQARKWIRQIVDDAKKQAR